MNLEARLPKCPIFLEIQDKHLQTCDIVIYGVPSNDCTKCKGGDPDCKIYEAWFENYAKQVVYKDNGSGI